VIDLFLKFNRTEKSLLWGAVACWFGGVAAYPLLSKGFGYPDSLAVPVSQYFFRTGGVVLFIALASAMWHYMRPVRVGEEPGEGAWDPAQAPKMPKKVVSDGAGEYEVVLTDSGHNKIGAIKAIREVTGLGLKEAKEMAEGTPSVVKRGMSKEGAREVVNRLESEGAKARVNMPQN
jgi:ribosomal protein L7/L12